ncbi:MAG: NifB/NifX family molybdenum-iron cluster-binding protein [Clostridiales bacterium]
MKICVSSTGDNMGSILDQRFGRTAFFIIVDSETMDFKVIDNEAAKTSGGAGIMSSQKVVEEGAEAVITGNVGPNAMKVLKAANIKIIKGLSVSVKENIEKYKKDLLSYIDNPVEQHFGINGEKK